MESDEKLRELGDYYEAVAEAQAKYEDKSDQAKTAKKQLEAATSALLEKVREYARPLPLFDADARERDQAAMEEAAR